LAIESRSSVPAPAGSAVENGSKLWPVLSCGIWRQLRMPPEVDLVGAAVASGDRNPPAGRKRVARSDGEVEQHPAHLARVGARRSQLARQFDLQPPVLANRPAQHLLRFPC
jgi:hypothetical protein